MKKKLLLFIILPILLFIIRYYFKPFINCPEWYSKVIHNHLWKYVSCENENWITSWISYEKSIQWYLQLFVFNDDKIISSKYYTSTSPKWYLFEECYRENWLRKCITYNKWKFNFLMGIKNFFRWFWGWYNTWSVLSIINKNEEYIYQWPYYLYYENWNLWLSWSYDKWLKTWLRIKYDKNWNIISRDYY